MTPRQQVGFADSTSRVTDSQNFDGNGDLATTGHSAAAARARGGDVR